MHNFSSDISTQATAVDKPLTGVKQETPMGAADGRTESTHGKCSIKQQNSVFRPIQYLGSKLRSLDVISQKVTDLVAPGATILDLFSGSTVVSQALADRGFNVIATDAMKYSEVFASALLGVDRNRDDLESEIIADRVIDSADFSSLEALFDEWLEEERVAIAADDGDRLIALTKEFPQAWRDSNATKEIAKLFCTIRRHEGESGFRISGIATSFYASTYLGIKQAITIDALRCSIERGKTAGHLNEWSQNACLTALLSSASLAAFTPGKHFAQYHKLSGSKSLEFHRKRIVTDRSVDIAEEFKKRLRSIYDRSGSSRSGHKSLQCTMEHLAEHPDLLGKIDLIYADPPYTAQQYSRFYHLPEVITSYQVPKLQLVSGRPTAGLYNQDRFKSRFSSKTKAPAAFRDMAALAASHESELLVSYSNSRSGVTGNSRMIELDELERIFSDFFETVDVLELDHAYRQFNSNTSAMKEREDREIMIHCTSC